MLRPLLLSAFLLLLAPGLSGCESGGLLPPRPAGGDLRAMVSSAAAQSHVPSRLAYAVMLQESAGNPQAISRAGAMGLMQLLPGTARAYGVDDPFDPWQNVLGGTRYLHDLLARYHGNMRLAVAAYNAGPGAVDRYRGVPPFYETRSYVARVLAGFGS